MMMLKNILSQRTVSQFTARGFHATALAAAYPVGKTGRPLPAYIRFVKENRPELLKKEPNLTIPESGRRLGEMWRALSESTRETYKEEFLKAYSEYKAKGGK